MGAVTAHDLIILDILLPQRECGRRGAATLLAKPHGLATLLDKLAAYNR